LLFVQPELHKLLSIFIGWTILLSRVARK